MIYWLKGSRFRDRLKWNSKQTVRSYERKEIQERCSGNWFDSIHVQRFRTDYITQSWIEIDFSQELQQKSDSLRQIVERLRNLFKEYDSGHSKKKKVDSINLMSYHEFVQSILMKCWHKTRTDWVQKFEFWSSCDGILDGNGENICSVDIPLRIHSTFDTKNIDGKSRNDLTRFFCVVFFCLDVPSR